MTGRFDGEYPRVGFGTSTAGYQWPPERARIGRQALRRPAWKGRLKLFEIHFLQDVESRRAITLVGVTPVTFDC
jgi:hypothetical protein